MTVEAQAYAAPGAWLRSPSIDARYNHTATFLSNGTVLVAGGYNGNYLTNAAIYDPAIVPHYFHNSAPLATARSLHTATLLSPGKVLMAGGSNNGGILASAELYDTAVGGGASMPTASMAAARYYHTATVLANGKVLVAGGLSTLTGPPLASAELYDPATATWSTTGDMADGRFGQSATLLSNGGVLVAGGNGIGGVLASAELYDPATGTWSPTGSMAAGRQQHTATMLSSGTVLVAGGSSVANAELYNPATGTWSTTAAMAAVRRLHTATLLTDGKVLVAGGTNASGVLASAELYDPATGVWSTTASMADARYSHTATLLSTGKVLVAGGHGVSGPTGSVELFDASSTGWLSVVSSPAVPTQILVDGEIADSWGVNGMNEPSGTHTVCFTHVDGWAEPSCQIVAVNDQATTYVTGSFIQRGELRVTTSPAVPSEITVDGSPTNDWGMWTDMSAGSHTVCFGAVPGYDPPGCQTATVMAGTQTTISGIFMANPSAVGQSGVGMLRVASSPAVPTQIMLDGQIANSWALDWLEVPPGSHTVCFSYVEGWTEPPCQTVTVNLNATTEVSGLFTQRGTLRVTTSPQANTNIWVDDIPRNDWGMWTTVPGGSYTVCFGPVAGYANTPACQTVMVNPGATTTVTGTYS